MSNPTNSNPKTFFIEMLALFSKSMGTISTTGTTLTTSAISIAGATSTAGVTILTEISKLETFLIRIS